MTTPGVFYKQLVCVGTESSFCEVSSVFDAALAVTGVSYEIVSNRAGTDGTLRKRLWDSRPSYRMPRSGGKFRVEGYLGGAQVDTATGALSATEMQKLLAGALGGSDLTGVGGVAGAGATTTAMASATGTHPRGTHVRVGQALDGRAGGQAAVVGATAAALLTAMAVAPSETDKIRASQMIYLKETLGSSKRFLVHYTDGDIQYAFHGCHAEAVTITTVYGDLPRYAIDYRYGYWRVVSGVDTSSLVPENCDTVLTSGGSDFLQVMGTTTRNILDAPVEMEITLNLGLQPVISQGGAFGPLQTVTQFVRKKGNVDEPAGTLRLTIPYDATQFADWDKDGSDSTSYHWLATLSPGEGTDETEGRHVTMSGPRLHRMGQRPAIRSRDDLQYMDVMFAFREGTDVTTDMSRSAFRIGLS